MDTGESLMNCPDCSAEIGENHLNGCDWECCAACGTQRLSCHCVTTESIPWTGKSLGKAECEEYNFYSWWDPKGAGNPDVHYGWMPCEKDHPEAVHDRNRLYRECVWSTELKKWVKEN
jgi:hypothetical protein